MTPTLKTLHNLRFLIHSFKFHKRHLLVVLILLTHSLFLIAQESIKSFTITQKTTIIMNGEPQGTPGKIIFTIKDNLAKSESNQMGAKMTTIYDHNTREFVIKSELGGQQQPDNKQPDFLNNQKSGFSKVEVEYINETKKIAGIECKKAFIVLTKPGAEVEKRYVWYAPEITLPFPFSFGVVGLDLIKGLPLEYENKISQFTMIHTAENVEIK
jgi:hypothetical protein